ncbi:transposase [Cyanobium sp. Morenito 9A2]|uniref:transposase n=1 Tax=Cyanobium sp. Morenito 9A2 TaxID=2823718 RepID=UPI0020CF6C85|nr:transposase [Cyanobium sp. Morenito 9A2]
MKSHLKADGIAMKEGTIINATVTAAPSSTMNKIGERDPEVHQANKGNQCDQLSAEGYAYGMKVHIGVDKEKGLIHSEGTTAANVHDLTPAADLLHGEETLVYADASYEGIEKPPEMDAKTIGFRVAMRPGKRRALPNRPEGRLDELVETVKDHIRARGEHPFRMIKQRFGFQKTCLWGMLKNHGMVNVLWRLYSAYS